MKGNLKMTEGIHGMWHYHLSNADQPHVALCGTRVMPTNIRISTWGYRSDHIGESYCKRCEELGDFTVTAHNWRDGEMIAGPCRLREMLPEREEYEQAAEVFRAGKTEYTIGGGAAPAVTIKVVP